MDRYVERAARAAGLQIKQAVPRGDLIQYFFSGDTHPDHSLVKCEFIFDTPPYFADPRLFDAVLVDDLLCIAVNKLTALSRLEPKDYVDLYLIIGTGRCRLEDLIPLAKQKDPGLDEWTMATSFKQVEQLPNLLEFQQGYMLIHIDPEDLIRFYENEAARLFALFPPRRQE